MTFGFHLCRGNQDSRWLVAGGYDEIAAPVFGAIHAHRLLLEYDDERSGDFDPLAAGPRRQAGHPRPGDHQGAPGRDRGGARGRVARRPGSWISSAWGSGTQCGFSTSVVGNALTVEDERRKLEVIARTAQRIWG